MQLLATPGVSSNSIFTTPSLHTHPHHQLLTLAHHLFGRRLVDCREGVWRCAQTFCNLIQRGRVGSWRVALLAMSLRFKVAVGEVGGWEKGPYGGPEVSELYQFHKAQQDSSR